MRSIATRFVCTRLASIVLAWLVTAGLILCEGSQNAIRWLKDVAARIEANQEITAEQFFEVEKTATKVANDANAQVFDLQELSKASNLFFSAKPLRASVADLGAKSALAHLLCKTIHQKLDLKMPLGAEVEEALGGLFNLCKMWLNEADSLKREIDASPKGTPFVSLLMIKPDDHSPEAEELRQQNESARLKLALNSRLSHLHRHDGMVISWIAEISKRLVNATTHQEDESNRNSSSLNRQRGNQSLFSWLVLSLLANTTFVAIVAVKWTMKRVKET